MERAQGGVGGAGEANCKKVGRCDKVKKWDALCLHPFMTILTSSVKER